MMRDNKRVTPVGGTEQHAALSARLAVISQQGSWQALRGEIGRIVFEVSQLSERSMQNERYHKFEEKVRDAMTKLEHVCAIMHELQRQGAPDT